MILNHDISNRIGTITIRDGNYDLVVEHWKCIWNMYISQETHTRGEMWKFL